MITKTQLPLTNSQSCATVVVTPLTSDSFLFEGGEILVATGGTAGGTITVQSQPNSYGRLGDLTKTLTANEVSIWGPTVTRTGWVDASGQIQLEATGSVSVFVLKP